MPVATYREGDAYRAGQPLKGPRPGMYSPPGVREGYRGTWSHVDGAKDSFPSSPGVPGVPARIDPGLRFEGTSPIQLPKNHVMVIGADLTEAVHSSVVLFRDKHAVTVLAWFFHDVSSGKKAGPADSALCG